MYEYKYGLMTSDGKIIIESNAPSVVIGRITSLVADYTNNSQMVEQVLSILDTLGYPSCKLDMSTDYNYDLI
jgi:hypothetical protein